MPAILRRDANQFGQAGADFTSSSVALLALVLLALSCVAALMYLRRRRRNAIRQGSGKPGHRKTLTITTSSSRSHGTSVFVYDEKMNLIANSSSPPPSPVPEIHVTFPEEKQESGETKAGRVVVLRISDSGSVGMEPLHHEPLPPYQRNQEERFHSLDLERLGGLKENAPVSGSGVRYS